MNYARILKSNRGQSVRLPKDCYFDVDQVQIIRRGDEIILRPAPVNAVAIFDALAQLPKDIFPEDRNDPPPQERDDF